MESTSSLPDYDDSAFMESGSRISCVSETSDYGHLISGGYTTAVSDESIKISLETSRTERVGSIYVSSDDASLSDDVESLLSLDRCQRLLVWANQHWLWELVACSLSIISLVVIIILLARYNGKPTPNWPSVITINSALALLTTLMKGSLVLAAAEGISQAKWSLYMTPQPLSDFGALDLASRGPWGSFLYLCSKFSQSRSVVKDDFKPSLKPHSRIIRLGTLIIVLAVTIEPFAQQVIAYSPCAIQSVSKQKAVLPRAQHFDGRARPIDAPSLERVFEASALTSQSGSILRVASQCETGNCSFSLPGGFFQTLAISYSCKEDSNSILNHTRSDDWRDTTRAAYSWTPVASDTNLTINATTLVDTGHSSIDRQRVLIEQDSTLFAIHALMYAGRSQIRDAQIKPVAFSCRFWPEWQTRTANISSGNLFETVVHQFPLRAAARNISTMYLQPLDHYLSDGVHESCTTINSSQEVINLSTIGIGEDGYLGVAYNETDSETKGPNKLADPGLVANGKADYYDPSCVVSISRSTTDIIQTLARRFFHHQTLDLTRFPNGVNKNITASGAMPALRKVFTDGLPSDLNNKHLEALFFNGNASLASVDAYAKGIADALTIHMRMYPVPGMKSNQPSIGIVQEIKTCAHARWVWLTLPVLLVIFNIGFLAAVILDNRRLANDKRWPGIIKSSPLGLFVYGPIIPAMENYHGPKDGVAMEYAAREVTTTLERRRAGINEKESD